MGKVFSVLKRRINRFNVENRAQTVITKNEPIPAPKHQSTIQEFEKIKQEISNLSEASVDRDAALHDNLKEVYVRSTDRRVEGQGSGSSRPLPQDRHAMEAPEFGFQEPTRISLGCCSLQQAVKFISDHQEDPVRWKHEIIAQEYKLQPQIVEKILQHYRMFQVYLPTNEDKKKESIFVLPMRKKKQLAGDPETKETKLKVSETAVEDK